MRFEDAGGTVTTVDVGVASNVPTQSRPGHDVVQRVKQNISTCAQLMTELCDEGCTRFRKGGHQNVEGAYAKFFDGLPYRLF